MSFSLYLVVYFFHASLACLPLSIYIMPPRTGSSNPSLSNFGVFLSVYFFGAPLYEYTQSLQKSLPQICILLFRRRERERRRSIYIFCCKRKTSFSLSVGVSVQERLHTVTISCVSLSHALCIPFEGSFVPTHPIQLC